MDNIEKTKELLILNGHYFPQEDIKLLNLSTNKLSIKLPLYSYKISAGFPSPADDHLEKTLDLNSYLIKHPAATFFVRVNGDSMINAGILDGDKVLIERTNVANNGDIVVALVDNNEATLKRLFRRGQQVALQPENASYETRIYGPDRIKIQGKLSSLIRNY